MPVDGVEDVQEALWAAAVLEVRPAVLADGAEVEAVAFGDEGGLVVTECRIRSHPAVMR